MKARLASLDYHAPSGDTSLNQLPVTIGRSPDAGIRLEDASVSNYHCRIECLDGQFVIADLGSRHGTFVNGARITESPLRPGDAIGIGMLSFSLQCLEDDSHPLTPAEMQKALSAASP